MRRRALLAASLALVAGCASPEPEGDPRGPPAGATEDVATLANQTFAFPPFGARVPMRVEARVEVLAGDPIDAWLATWEECQRYGQRRFAPNASLLGAREGLLAADLPAGDACLVLDNADFALGRANGTGEVVVRYRIEVWERAG